MPQLKPDIAERIDEQEYTGGILENGVYEVILKEVEARPGKVAPVWSWRFEVAPGQKGEGRTLYTNTSLSEAADWKLKEAFNAFGVPATTDTDLILGQRCKALVYKSIAQGGKREGQYVNAIQELLPVGRATLDPNSATKQAKSAAPDPEDPTARPAGAAPTGDGLPDEPRF
jgi:hypothetical protein